MRNLYVIILCAIVLFSCRPAGKDDPFQKKLSKENALKDFEAFRSILTRSHPSLTLYLTDKKIKQLFDSTAKTITGDISTSDLFLKYTFLTNEIGCAHTLMDISPEMRDTLGNRKYFFPLAVKLIEGRLLVNLRDQELPEGSEIISINQQPAEKILKDIMMYEPVEGKHRNIQSKMAAENFAVNYFYSYGSKSHFIIQYKDTAGKSRNKILDAITLNELEMLKSENLYYFERTECDYDLSIYDDQGYAYMRIRTFSFDGSEKQNAFENFCANSFELLSLKKNIHSLIIDVRENTGGDLYYSGMLYAYLSKEEFKEFESAESKINMLEDEEYLEKNFSLTSRDRVNKMLSKEFTFSPTDIKYNYTDSLIETWSPSKNAFKGNVFVITNARVASAASYFSVMVKNSGRGLVVGDETTGGSYSGNGFTNLNYALPYSDLRLIFPYVHLVYTYKENKNKGRGLLPNFSVPDSYESFKNNSDNQFYFIRDSLISKIKK